MLYTNNRAHAPRYTPHYQTTFNWYFTQVGRQKKLMIRGLEAKQSAGGRKITWYKEDLVLIAGVPLR